MEDKKVIVTKIWSDIFGEENSDYDDNFFELGGDFMRTRTKQNLTSLYLILQRTVMYSRRNRTGHGQQIRTSDWKDRLI